MRPDPYRARERLAQQIEAGRGARRRRFRLLIASATSLVTLLVAGSAWAVTSYLNSSIGRIDAGTSGTPSSGPVNILVAGVDTRGGLTRREEIRLHVGNAISENSDVLMLVHIPADHSRVQVVSLPRDSWVDIPGHGMNKINAAIGLGGPRLMVRTVEKATGLAIDDYLEIDFLGFVKVINALGGVNVCLPYAVHDSYSGLHLSAGEHHVDGVTALEFARDRHSFALSDIARISDQQQLVSSLFSEMTKTGVLADPFRLQHVMSAVASAITVDTGFNLVGLADELRGLRPSDVTFTTVPLSSINYQTPTGQSAVLWDKPAAAALFSRLRKDGRLRPRSGSGHRGRDRGSQSSAARAKAARAVVSIDVYNGTMINHLSALTGRELARLGFHLHGAGLNWSRHDVPQTTIEYPPDHEKAARLVRAALPGAVLRRVPGLTLVKIVLGARDYQVRGAHNASKAGHKQASTVGAIPTTGRQKTAAQDACH